ncbi:universal stress protein [Sinomonas atrocyanea]|jgi:nucleotide-binding universal stress UspA family protein|uniref:universal stress protein n=1 Tax=Sinomonas atrocyanea TaxID=37927 RepID=UPI0027835317|nr:universal stress protein [Sinomonas atrocyanea]MDQ0261360.1 nucleotide-binding universal stress UspA family protein [Sinomonas atrocyanea]MDR6622941.1 nucleotide-binding universal stress UspA family protein [Sinomonas atrocyanea]
MSDGKAYRIVVGVDGSPGSVLALEWALEEAKLRGGTIRVITAWHYPALGEAADTASDYETLKQAAARAQTKLLAGAQAKGAPSSGEVIEGAPVQVLLEAAGDADLLVVGSRGHGGFRGLLLGSVSSQLVHHAPCPVTIVRHPKA